MNEVAFQRLKEQIQTDNPRGLKFVFDETNRYCTRTLIKKTGCSMDDAEDIFMDSIIIFRENILSEKLVSLTNVKTYIFGICWNLWRDLNRARVKWQKEQNEVERQFLLINETDELPFEFSGYDPVKSKVRSIKHALEALSEKCRRLLTFVYIEQRSQKEIAELMQFASAGVVKVTRHRCYQQWVKKIEQNKLSTHGTE